MFAWQRSLKMMLSVGLVVLGIVVLYQCFKSSPNIQSLKVVRISNVAEIYYPASAKVFVDHERYLFRFDLRIQHQPISFYVRNVKRREKQSFDEVLALIREGRAAEGRQFVGQFVLETKQRVLANVLVFEHRIHHEIREWIVMENPYHREHIVAVHWSSSKGDYSRVRKEIHEIIKLIRLTSGPPEWLEDKPVLRRDENVG